MANRKHVTNRRWLRATAAGFVGLLVIACSDAGPQPTEFRGRVIDMDTGMPIEGAIVVGKYVGSRGAEGSTACNRVESAVSDKDGWFMLPIDSRDDMPMMEAYARGYRWGRSPFRAQRAVDGNMNHWQVQVVKWNAEVDRGELVRYEPTVYRSERDAIAASRQELDVYLKSVREDQAARLYEVHRLHVAGACVAPHRTTAGPVPFFAALLEEEIELGDGKTSLDLTREFIREAEESFSRAKGANK